MGSGDLRNESAIEPNGQTKAVEKDGGKVGKITFFLYFSRAGIYKLIYFVFMMSMCQEWKNC